MTDINDEVKAGDIHASCRVCYLVRGCVAVAERILRAHCGKDRRVSLFDVVYVGAVCRVDEGRGCKYLALNTVFVNVGHPGLHLAAANGYSVNRIVLGDSVLITALTRLACIDTARNVCVDACVNCLSESHSLGNCGIFAKLLGADENEHTALGITHNANGFGIEAVFLGLGIGEIFDITNCGGIYSLAVEGIYAVGNVILAYTVILGVAVERRVIFVGCHRYPKMLVGNSRISLEEIAVHMGAQYARAALRCGKISARSRKHHNGNGGFGVYGINDMHFKVEVECRSVLRNAIGDVKRLRVLDLYVFSIGGVCADRNVSLSITVPLRLASVKGGLRCLLFEDGLAVNGKLAYPFDDRVSLGASEIGVPHLNYTVERAFCTVLVE